MFEPKSGKIRTSFLQGYKFIGGDLRCILNTQHVLQEVFSFLQPHMKSLKKCKDATAVVAKAAQNKYFFAWHEDTHPARRVRIDLDRLLACHILPELINACCVGSQKYPIGSNIFAARFLPLLAELNTYLNRDLGGPVPVHVTFGFHCMLIAIIALQGNRHMQRLGDRAKTTVQTHYQKMNKSLKQYVKGDDDDDGVVYNYFHYWTILKQAWPPTLRESSRFVAYWNPLMAGSFCLYSVYNGLQIGTLFSANSMMRVLHIYNSLRCRNLIEPMNILDLFDSIFAEAQGVWATGTKCQQTGDFYKSYLLGFGMTVRDAALFRAMAQEKFAKGKFRIRNYFDDKKNSLSLKPENFLEPRQFSRGTNLLLYRNFAGIDIANMRKSRLDVEDDTECEVFIVMACQALKDDLDLFGGSFLDWIAIGHTLKQFELLLLNNKGGIELKDLEDDGFSYPDDLLGELDFCPKAKLRHAPRYASLFKSYFKDIQRSEFIFSGSL